MKNIGIYFDFSNLVDNPLLTILNPISCELYNWEIFSNDIHLIGNDGKLVNDLLFNNIHFIDGETFYSTIKNSDYYLIFAGFNAFPKDKTYEHVGKYDKFLNSNCEIVIDIYDSVYTTILCKNAILLEEIYKNAIKNNFSKVRYLTDDDIRSNPYAIYA
ncbi:DUF2691 family protein [Clostridium cadaveris]|uniref:DUF2691 domain-containing protein n=1 Tax=Clostridium cadaveris TaxID=1529 RepID=A0A1I2L1T3_9CLOT|nr:DUF2691 family protein [Clostridium cadaveris]MDM8311141.1 DUF2691 family protein [Clostridium cadaveris]SFF72518.1 Protein of unknown function [Clostridium cadaveris]